MLPLLPSLTGPFRPHESPASLLREVGLQLGGLGRPAVTGPRPGLRPDDGAAHRPTRDLQPRTYTDEGHAGLAHFDHRAGTDLPAFHPLPVQLRAVAAAQVENPRILCVHHQAGVDAARA